MKPYITQPTVAGTRIVFVNEDDLWSVDIGGGLARRLTNAEGRLRSPRLSPDGSLISVLGNESGVWDLYTLPAEGGRLERRTWIGSGLLENCGFDPDGAIVFSSAHDRPFQRDYHPRKLDAEGRVVSLGLGSAIHVTFGPDGRRALVRHQTDLANWRAYRGGRVGQLWRESDDGFVELESLGGNLVDPMWLGDRLYFLSDHEGTGNLFSTNPDGGDLKQHTHHETFPARFASSDGAHIVYVRAGDIHVFDLASGSDTLLEVETHSQRVRTQTRHPAAARYLEGASLHPKGHALALGIRGRTFVGGLWEGPMRQVGEKQGVHQRLATFLSDGRLVWASDAEGDEHLAILELDGTVRHFGHDLGRVTSISVGKGDQIAVITHTCALHVVDVGTGEARCIEANPNGMPGGAVFSRDGRWLTWSSCVLPWMRSKIMLADLSEEKPVLTEVTDGTYRDYSPDFDPQGRFLYFLSVREFDAVREFVRFDYAFPKGVRPYLVTLSRDTPNPFRPGPRDVSKPKPGKPTDTVEIDVDGIADRIVRFPVAEARYTKIRGLPSGKVLMSRRGLPPAKSFSWKSSHPPAVDSLFLWDFNDLELLSVYPKMSGFTLDHPRKTCLVRIGSRLRVFPADADKGVRAELKKNEPVRFTRKGRWVDPGRARIQVEPPAEWAQMLDESWRLVRDYFWDRDMTGVDWPAARERFAALVPRVSVRSELADLMRCQNGELGTSHAYQMGGEYKGQFVRQVGRLAADVSWDGEAWRIDALHPGDRGDPARSCPLLEAGVNATIGTRIHTVNGEPVDPKSLYVSLVGHAGRPVHLGISEPDGEVREVEVRALGSDQQVRYRTWVANCRAHVRERTQGRVGYVHLPNMGPVGYADFFRDFISEAEHDALIVDVRFNGGGHVSQLVLTALNQKRLGYSVSRHFKTRPYPASSIAGPMVALTNECAGSDGDIFSQHWKGLGLGPLVGTRTWGGTIGISPRNRLIDGTIVTQPEFANWVAGGVGFGMENGGVHPDVVVNVHPEDDAKGLDRQLDRAIDLILEGLEENPVHPPDFGPPPPTA